MRNQSLQEAAKELEITRPALIKRMREAGLIDDKNLPTHPLRDRFYLEKHESSWHHPELGQQYSYSTRVRPAGIAWLREKLGIPLPLPPAVQDRRDVG
ncbi:DNA-binding protein [Pseudomonas nitroreducens]|uniref:phage antirepressor KilAC domain-containing protein n=1 Tax=Pseudomonas TaxID=286 RepID=UPI0007EE844F|nr:MULTISPECIES: phage antirepressor KilAC domain-containing protein [Pseudomonas]NMZ72952.1 DNA-binding protein [Pseudomonas nitroreducens]OBY59442.1 DNA-binding protein [Pseudomonas sp. AU12215]